MLLKMDDMQHKYILFVQPFDTNTYVHIHIHAYAQIIQIIHTKIRTHKSVCIEVELSQHKLSD